MGQCGFWGGSSELNNGSRRLQRKIYIDLGYTESDKTGRYCFMVSDIKDYLFLNKQCHCLRPFRF